MNRLLPQANPEMFLILKLIPRVVLEHDGLFAPTTANTGLYELNRGG
jgi:hypothetical protein